MRIKVGTLAAVLLVTLFVAGVASAGSIYYELEATKLDPPGIELTGFIRLPDSLLGQTDFAAWDLLDYGFAAVGPSLSESWTTSNSIVADAFNIRFASPVGAPVLAPISAFAGEWSFGSLGGSPGTIDPILDFRQFPSGLDWRIRWSSLGTAYSQEGWQFVRKPDPAPEPGSLALMALGGLGLAWCRRRRKSA